MARLAGLPGQDVEVERAVEEGSTDHRALAAERLERIEVVAGSDAAGGDHGQSRGFEHAC